MNIESNRTVFDSRWGFYADHRSEDWKIRIRPYFNYDLVRIERDGQANVRSMGWTVMLFGVWGLIGLQEYFWIM